MSWSDCGIDSRGRPIGYSHSATCDARGCRKRIDRGLSYACGGMHGKYANVSETVEVCEGYFCEKHLFVVELKSASCGLCISVCEGCEKELQEAGMLVLEEADA